MLNDGEIGNTIKIRGARNVDNNKEAQDMYEAIIRKSIQWYESEVSSSNTHSNPVWVPIPQSAIPNKH